jgi:hypothetical protein
MPDTTQLAGGQIDGRDQLQVILVTPTDGTPALVRVHWPQRPTTVTAAQYANVAAVITRLIAESAIALARHKVGNR